ncbi:MAG: HD domain-containing phosphohydrolase [Deltaproteobacteria bacterium]
MKRAPSNYEQTRLNGHATLRRQSPFYLLVIIVIAIFVAETFVMFLLSVFPPFSTTVEMLVDPFILVVLVFPLLYFFLFNPLLLHITERERAEEGLRKYQERLEELVEERTVGLQKEIQEREIAHEALLASEVNYRNLTEGLSEVIYSANPNTMSPTYVNKAVENVYGYTVDEWLKTPNIWEQTIHPDDREMVISACVEADRQKKNMTLEYRIIHKDGSVRWVEDRLSRELDRFNNVVTLNGVIYDITERRQAETSLKESEEKFRTICASALDAILMMDKDGYISFWNGGAERIFGHTSGFATGKYLHELLVPERYRASFSMGFTKFRETGEGAVVGKTLEVFALRKDGSEFPVELSVSSVKLEGQWGVMGIIQDITGRKKAQERNEGQLKQLAALRAIDMTINASLDLHVTLDVILNEVLSQLKVPAADILLYDRHLQILEFAAGKGFLTKALQYTSLGIGESHAGRAALERRIVHVQDLGEDGGEFRRSDLLKEEGFVSYYAVPLIAKGEVKGILEIFDRAALDPDRGWLDFLDALAGQTAIAIDNNAMFENLQRSNTDLVLAYDATIEGWSRALDLRDKETEGHSRRVTEMSLRLARAMGVSREDQAHIHRGALLHDIGKMGIPDNILNKSGKLTDAEWEIMRRHPEYAYELLSPVEFLRQALDIPYCHHERWDGKGYPRGLKGEQIPLLARIFTVADIFDALCSDRPYRPAWPRKKALEHISSLSGVDLDPAVVEIFLRMENEGASRPAKK